MAQMKKNEQKPQTRQIAPGITLTGWGSVEKWDDEVRRAVSAKRQCKVQSEKCAKDVHFTPELKTP